jgi:hypothetical protein
LDSLPQSAHLPNLSDPSAADQYIHFGAHAFMAIVHTEQGPVAIDIYEAVV